MKPYEQFVGNILQAVRDSQGKDPGAATEIIQQALRSAGLLRTNDAGAADPQAAHTAHTLHDAGAGKFGDWAERLRAFQRGHGPAQERPDPRAPGQFLHGEFGNEAGSRRYRLYVPSTPAKGARALIVMLHGCTQDPVDFATGTAMNVLAEQHDCLVLYPEQPQGANANKCWNWFEAGHQQASQGEPAIIAGMTRDIIREHGADPKRVFVAGLSAGGAMAAVMGAAYPDLYRAVGVHSGLPLGCAHDLMSGLNAMKGAHGKGGRRSKAALLRVPAIVIHGDQDAVVHPSNGEAVFGQCLRGSDGALTEVQETGERHTRTMALDPSGRVIAEHWVLQGAGHAWAGGSAQGSHTDPSGPDASAAMLRFFLAQA